MTKSIKRIVISTLAVLFSFALMFGVLFNNKTAYADQEFTMVETTQIRYNEDDNHNGLMFMAKLGVIDADAEYHIIIVPSSYLIAYESGDYKDFLTSYIDAQNGIYGTSIELMDIKCTPFATDGQIYIRASITNVLYTNLAREFTGIAYYEKNGTRTYAGTTTSTLLDTAVSAKDSGEWDDNQDISTFLDNSIKDGITSALKEEKGADISSKYTLRIKNDDNIVELAKNKEVAVDVGVYNSNGIEKKDVNKFIRTSIDGIEYDSENKKIIFSEESLTKNTHGNLVFNCYGLTSTVFVPVDIFTDLTTANTFSKEYVESGRGWTAVSDSIALGYDDTFGLATLQSFVGDTNQLTFYSNNWGDYKSSIVFDKTLFELAKEDGYTTFTLEVSAKAGHIRTNGAGVCFYSHKSLTAGTSAGLNDGFDDSQNRYCQPDKNNALVNNPYGVYSQKLSKDTITPVDEQEVWTKSYSYSHSPFGEIPKKGEGTLKISVSIDAILQREGMDKIGFNYITKQTSENGILYVAGGNFSKDLIGENVFRSYRAAADAGWDGKLHFDEGGIQFYKGFDKSNPELPYGYLAFEGYEADGTENPQFKYSFSENVGTRESMKYTFFNVNNGAIWDAYTHGQNISFYIKGSLTEKTTPSIYIYSGSIYADNRMEYDETTGALPDTSFINKTIMATDITSEYVEYTIDVKKFVEENMLTGGNRLCILVDGAKDDSIYFKGETKYSAWQVA